MLPCPNKYEMTVDGYCKETIILKQAYARWKKENGIMKHNIRPNVNRKTGGVR